MDGSGSNGRPKSFGALDAKDTAELLCLTRRQLSNLVDLGLPKEGHGKASYYDWNKVFQWYIAYKIAQSKSKMALKGPAKDVDPNTEVEGETFAHALCRKTIADADLKELELAKGRGEVVAVADVERSVSNVAVNLKDKLLGIPAKLTGILFGLKTKAQIRAALDAEMRQLCGELVNIGASNDNYNL
jgi:phage terminase Nu1 subunit (DNA packaging protein)